LNYGNILMVIFLRSLGTQTTRSHRSLVLSSTLRDHLIPTISINWLSIEWNTRNEVVYMLSEKAEILILTTGELRFEEFAGVFPCCTVLSEDAVTKERIENFVAESEAKVCTRHQLDYRVRVYRCILPENCVDIMASRFLGSMVPNARVPRKTCSKVSPQCRKCHRNKAINLLSASARKI